jgi:hypothetical protein
MTLEQMPEPFLVRDGAVWFVKDAVLFNAPLSRDNTFEPDEANEVYATDSMAGEEGISQTEIGTIKSALKQFCN